MTKTKSTPAVEAMLAEIKAEAKAAKSAKAAAAEQAAVAYEGSYAEYKTNKNRAIEARDAKLQARIDASFRAAK